MKIRLTITVIFTLLVTLTLGGCMVGPKYVKPDTPMTTSFKEAPPDSFKETKNWKFAQPGAPSLPAKWWETFGDEQLTALEQQVAAGNQDLKIAEARFRQARALIRVNRASEFPTISTSPGIASLRDSQNQPYFALPAAATGEFVLPFDLSYEVDLWGRVRRTVNASREEAQAVAADLATATLTIQAELAYDYFELRAADAQKQLLDDTVKAYADALQLTRNRFEGGAAPKSDVAQAQTQLDTALARQTDIEVQRAQYEHAIATLLGKPSAAFSLAAKPLNAAPPAIPVGLPSAAPRTASRYRRFGAPCARGKRTDRHRPRGLFSYRHSGRVSRIGRHFDPQLAELAKPLLGGRTFARGDPVRRRPPPRWF